MKISVIVPVYNAELTLGHALEGLKHQSFRDFEVVFVDDCSTDGSAGIMRSFAESGGIPCQIVRQEKNGGVAAARKRGLDAARGDYLAFLDADDSVPEESFQTAISALKPDTDILGWDWHLGFEKNARYMRQADYATPVEAVKNLMGGTMRWNLWLFLVRRKLLKDSGIRFINGANMGEDMQFMIRAFLAAKEVVQVHEPLYIYNAVSTSSISRQFSEERRREIEVNLAEVEKVVRASGFPADLSDYVNYLKLYLKLPLLVSPDVADYRLWHGWFPESNGFAMANKALPLRTRLLQHFAAHQNWFAVKLYYLAVHKFVYGLLYR